MSRAITGLGTQYYIGGRVGDPFAGWTLLGELASFDFESAWDMDEVTNFDSGVDREHKKTLRNPGTFTLYGNRLQDDPGQVILRAAFDDPRAYHFLVIMPFGEQWSFHGLVLSVDPPLFAPGKTLRFVSKIQVTGPRWPFPVFVNATGHAEITLSRPFGRTFHGAIWEGFSVPLLPSDAEIQGIYPVLIASATHDQAFSSYSYGVGLNLLDFGGIGFVNPSNPNNTSFASTEFWGASIGTSLSALSTQNIKALVAQSLDIDVLYDVIDVTGVGYAIYYTSEKLLIDPQMPPPFAVPALQGVAWSLPFAVQQTGIQVGCLGIFCPSSGKGLGTPAVLS